jgi:universal stress protein E
MKRFVDAFVEPYRNRIDIKTKILNGVHFLEIIREVLRNNRDLVIKIPESRDWLRHLFGSDDMHLLRKCPCPVWLIKPEVSKTFRRILAAVDGEDSYPEAELKTRNMINRQIIEMASSLAISEFAELHIVTVWDAVGESFMRRAFSDMSEVKIVNYIDRARMQHKKNMETLFDEVCNTVSKDAMNYLKPQMHLVKSWARKEIPELTKHIEIDLIIMGTVVRTGIPGFIIGNTAETILNQINCSVLAIKPPGFITPITLQEGPEY